MNDGLNTFRGACLAVLMMMLFYAGIAAACMLVLRGAL